MKKTLIIFGLLITSISFATTKEISPDFSRFENITKIKVSGITTPKVVKFKTHNFQNGRTVLLNEKNEIISHKWIRSSQKIKSQNITASKVSSNFEGRKENLVDGNYNTSLTFHPETDYEKEVTLSFNKLTEVSGIYIRLADGIINPKTVTVKGTFSGGENVIIVNNKRFSYHIPFPKVSVSQLQISYNTPHFLRISEIEILGQEEIEKTDELVFFAEEGKTYTLYSNSHFGQKHYSAPKYQPLSTDNKTPAFTLPLSTKNPVFNDDFDGDELSDQIDLCPKIADPQNIDIDNNKRGDACEDPDQDSKMSSVDNCPFIYNPNQKDSDLDKLGDLCDDTDDRFTANSQSFLYIVFGLAALFLGFLVWRSLKK